MKFEAFETQLRQITGWVARVLDWTVKPLLYGDRLKLQQAAKKHLVYTAGGVTASDLKRMSKSLKTHQSNSDGLPKKPASISSGLKTLRAVENNSVQHACGTTVDAVRSEKMSSTYVTKNATISTIVSGTYNGPERRSQQIRRNFTPDTFWHCLTKPRRFSGRRRSDRRYPLMDVFDASAMFLAVALIVLSLTDAFLTLNILAGGGREVNPVMNYMLGFGTLVFVSFKMLMTALPIAALTAAGNLIVFKYLRVRTVTAILVGMYAGLITYELLILSMMR